jgi:hypothetical protein
VSDLYEWPEALPHMIVPGLFQGGTEDHDVVWEAAEQRLRGSYPFDVVVTLYADANPVPWGVEELRFGFYDAALDPSDVVRVVELAQIAHARWAGGQQVLVRCQAGINRSGLVTALILMMSGMDAGSAIALIRERRSAYVLSNAHFEQWLLHEAASWLDVVSDSNAA